MQTGLICLELVARISGIDIDLRTVVNDLALSSEEISVHELRRAAKQCGFKSSIKRTSLDRLPANYPLPLMYIAQTGSYGLVLRLNREKRSCLIFVPEDKQPKEVTYEEFSKLTSGALIALVHRKSMAQTMYGFQWFLSEAVRYKAILIEVLIASFVVQLFGVVTPLFTQLILDKVLVHKVMDTLQVIAVGFLAVSFFEFVLNLIRNYAFNHTACKLDATLGARLFRHLFSLPFAYFESRPVGTIARRVAELDNIREFVTNKSVSVVIDTIFSVVFIAMMAFYSIELTAVVLTFISIIGILYVTVTPELRRRLENKFQMASQSQSYLVESVTGVQTVKSLAMEGAMQRKWEDALANYISASFNLTNIGSVAGAVSNLFQKLMTLAILYFGVRLVIENKLTVGQLIAFQMYAGQFSQPVLRLVNLWNEFQQALLGVDRLGDILAEPTEIQTSKAITLSELKGDIKLDKVGFKYTVNGTEVLSQLSLSIPPGTSIGIVGKSGSGKSTIAKLLQRLYVPTAGAIYIDGIDARHLNPTWLRKNTGVVLQDSFCFSGSIRENICQPKPDASMDEILRVAKIAGAHEFISQLPEGYDTFVGERGSALSGGQRQRIAIARALINNPRILIFDEATSALDYESEAVIQRNLHEIKKNRTFIVVAHRLSTVRDCNMIIVMDKGRIIEMGNHQTMSKKNGPYARLLNQQAILQRSESAPSPMVPFDASPVSYTA
jgi:ATP-binding cassette, subfamily B, bacterial HlyB/CyaB